MNFSCQSAFAIESFAQLSKQFEQASKYADAAASVSIFRPEILTLFSGVAQTVSKLPFQELEGMIQKALQSNSEFIATLQRATPPQEVLEMLQRIRPLFTDASSFEAFLKPTSAAIAVSQVVNASKVVAPYPNRSLKVFDGLRNLSADEIRKVVDRFSSCRDGNEKELNDWIDKMAVKYRVSRDTIVSSFFSFLSSIAGAVVGAALGAAISYAVTQAMSDSGTTIINNYYICNDPAMHTHVAPRVPLVPGFAMPE